MTHVLDTESPSATERLGERLGRIVCAGDVVLLSGDLGAGKTCFVRGLGRGLGVRPRAVHSPTFNIVVEHEGRIPLYHVDLYRIMSRGELDELGMETYLYGQGVAAVEWIERFPELAPAEHIAVRLEFVAARRRRVTVEGRGRRGSERVTAWLGDEGRGSD